MLSTTVLILSVGTSGICAATESAHDIQLPPETVALTASTLPGYKIATQKCGICHSADYINLQPPHMTMTQWTAEMAKMQHSYGAPIDDAEIKLLGIYLASTYGDASSVPPSDLTKDATAAAPDGVPPEMPTKAPAASGADHSNIDVHAVLERNACLSCHALQQKIVGPAYHDVAVKYAADPRAHGTVEANIRMGGSGKWGMVPMPPFPNLSSAELKVLADFVLAQ
jgi:cytochrome c551/c552